MGVIKGDTRSLDYSSYGDHIGAMLPLRASRKSTLEKLDPCEGLRLILSSWQGPRRMHPLTTVNTLNPKP